MKNVSLRIAILAGVAAVGIIATPVIASASAYQQAASSSERQDAIAAATPLSGQSLEGRTVAFRRTVLVPAGSRSVAGSAPGVTYSITLANISSQTSPCTLTTYNPYWFAESNADNFVQASAYISCDERVAQISVTAALYSGVSPYSLLGDATTTADNTNGVFGVYNYQIYGYGYYITGAVGYAGSPLYYSAPEQYSPITYISWPT